MASEEVSILPLPAKLESCTLFAYPVRLTQSVHAPFFSPHCSAVLAGRAVEAGFESRNDGSFRSRKSSSASDCDGEAQLAARRTSLLAKTVVENCMLEDDDSSDLDLILQAADLARDQLGCRYLQTKLEEGGSALCQAVFSQVFPCLCDLMTHPFGNYVCQKLIEAGTRMQLEVMLDSVAPHMLSIAMNTHGTRVVQKLIEQVASTSLVLPLRTLLEPAVAELSRDLNGSHVLQRCLGVWQSAHNQFIYDAVCLHTVALATHRHGCCVLQRCVDFATPQQFSQLSQAIVASAVELVQDAFGNYAVQYILDRNDPSANRLIAEVLTPRLVDLSRQKFASNVIEKCLQLNEGEVQQSMIRALGESQRLGELLGDQYANYVVQRALTLAKPAVLSRLLAVPTTQMIRPSLDGLRGSQLGLRVYTKLMKKYPALNDRSRRTLSSTFTG